MHNNINQRAQTEGTPLIDNTTATFVWLGNKAPLLTGDFNDWERGSPVQLKQITKGVWTYQLELPPDAYIEYAYVMNRNRIPDPLNQCTTPNGIGDTNHYFYMPQGAPTPLVKSRRSVAHGMVSKYVLDCKGILAGRQRAVWLYQPPIDTPAPLLVVWDGKDYLRRARLPVIIDNLISQKRIQPVALALIENGGPARTAEYACSEASLLFLLGSVLPLAKNKLNLLDVAVYPGAFGLLGASMGGLITLFTALRFPHIFGKVLCQSGAFAIGGYESIIFDLVRHADPNSVKIWMDIGRYDFRSLIEADIAMHSLLLERGFNIEHRQYSAGHNYPAWRDEVWRGLEYLYPPDLTGK